jgi:hypothetical protein
MKTTENRGRHPARSLLLQCTALFLAVCLLPGCALAQETQSLEESGWITFLLICNEGMNNDKGNAGNTLMVVGMHPDDGKVRLMMFTWDTFVNYPGYDVPQKLDMPYRNNGPEEAMEVFNENFGLNIRHYMSLNYLNLASMIDDYGGVNIDISRAERNALNGLVASKKNRLQEEVGTGLLAQNLIDMLAQEYYLTEFGPDTHLNGLQAVGYGWLQYDSVYNCCERDAKVIAALFHRVSAYMTERVVLYTDASGYPDYVEGRRAINLDDVTEEDYEFLHQQIGPIFQKSFNNMSEEEIRAISLALARVAYQATRQGADIFDTLRFIVLPLEAREPYDIVAGTKGHLVDKEANREAVLKFLLSEDTDDVN